MKNDCSCDVVISEPPEFATGNEGAFLIQCTNCNRSYRSTVGNPDAHWPYCFAKCGEQSTVALSGIPPAQPELEMDSLQPSDVPCVHRQGEVAQEICAPCSGQAFKVIVYGCDERARCTLRAYKAGQKEVQCLTCRDRVEPKCFLPVDL